jgi:effector-binding domain-containing protein
MKKKELSWQELVNWAKTKEYTLNKSMFSDDFLQKDCCGIMFHANCQLTAYTEESIAYLGSVKNYEKMKKIMECIE